MAARTQRSAALREVMIVLLNEEVVIGRASGDAAAWICPCKKDRLPLVAAPRAVTVCPKCGRQYKYVRDAGHRHGGHVEEMD